MTTREMGEKEDERKDSNNDRRGKQRRHHGR